MRVITLSRTSLVLMVLARWMMSTNHGLSEPSQWFDRSAGHVSMRRPQCGGRGWLKRLTARRYSDLALWSASLR